MPPDWPDDDRWDGEPLAPEHDLPPHGDVRAARRDEGAAPRRRRRGRAPGEDDADPGPPRPPGTRTRAAPQGGQQPCPGPAGT